MMRALRPAHWIIIAISVSLIGFIAWSFWAELDQVTRAKGRVVPFARVQVVQSEEGGVISAINVREGDRVRAGQVLIELDEVQLAASLEESRARVAALRSRMARIDAELFDKPLNFPASLSDYPEFVANQRQLFTRRKAALAAEINALRDAATRQDNYRLPGATLYVTIEPCTMCFGALIHARIARLVYGATEPRAGVCESRLELPGQDFYNHRIEVLGGVEADAASQLMRRFFRQRRG